MMNLLIKSTAFLVIGTAIYLLLAAIGSARAPQYAEDRLRVARMLEQASAIQAINVGPSHNRAIDYATLGVPGYHAWFSGSDSKETVYFLENILQFLPRLRIVMICVAPTSLHSDNALLPERERNRHKLYYLTPGLSSWQPIPGDWRGLMAGKLAGVVRDDHWEAVLRGTAGRTRQALPLDLDLPQEDLRTLAADGRPLKRDDRVFTAEPAGANKATEHAQTVRLTMARNPRVAAESAAQLDRLLARLKSHPLQVVLFTPPYTDLYYTSLQQSLPEVVAENRRILQALAARHGIRYLDCRDDPDFSTSYRLFADSDHMNRLGAEVFSRKLAGMAPEIFTASPAPAEFVLQ